MKEKKSSNRRDFILKTALGSGLIGSLSSFDLVSKISKLQSQSRTDLHLNMAGYDYPRVKAIFDNKIKIKGCSFDIEKGSISDLNTNAFSGPQTYNVSEIGLLPFMIAYANEEFRDYSLLPIFPLRMFRHKSVYIRNDRGINSPQDLKGRTIGTPGYSSTSLTWIRGIFQDEYGIDPKDVNWVVSNKDSSAAVSGKVSKQEQVVPKGINIKLGTAGLDESDLLVSGEVDALFHAAEPKAYVEGNPLVDRLFPDSKRVEQTYFKKTGIFPIMHAIAVKNSLIDTNPWLVESLTEAYSKAKLLDYQYMTKLAWAYNSLPWYGQELQETRKLMGKNFYSYGIENNRKTLKTLFRYGYEQGLCNKELTINELFHPLSLDFIEK